MIRPGRTPAPNRSGSPADPDLRLLRHAQRVLAVRTAAAIAVSMLLVGVLAMLVVTTSQRHAAMELLVDTAATATDVADSPPPGVWLFEQSDDAPLIGTANPPPGLPDREAIDRVHAGGPTETRAVTGQGDDYLVLTRQRGGSTLQVAISQHEHTEEQHRLLAALALAELVGLVVAILFATLLARRATAPLGEALARQRQFVADASHELRAPLTQIHTRAQLLERDLRAGATAADLTDDISRLVTGTRHLGEVVEDLLLSTQLRHQEHLVAEVDLAELSAQVIAEQSARAADGQVTLSLLADLQAPAIVRGREAALRRVLIALADNALSHTPPGGHIVVEVSAQNHQIVLQVRDDGSGLDPADTERIFARFARAAPDDQRRFGLGLALAREVVVGHGGTITASGHPGAGATFTIRLPAPPG